MPDESLPPLADDLEGLLNDDTRLEGIFKKIFESPKSERDIILRDLALTQEHPQLGNYAQRLLKKYDVYKSNRFIVDDLRDTW